jgi:hypothetical protein
MPVGDCPAVNMKTKRTDFKCACDKFERLEGAAVQVYISDFLEMTDVDETSGKTYYACRFCGRPWVRETAEDARKSSLTRLETEFNV